MWFLVVLVCLCVLGVAHFCDVALDTSKAWEVLPAAHSESSIRALSCLCVALELLGLFATLQALWCVPTPRTFSEDMKSGQQTR